CDTQDLPWRRKGREHRNTRVASSGADLIGVASGFDESGIAAELAGDRIEQPRCFSIFPGFDHCSFTLKINFLLLHRQEKSR
ncbi:MAG: hypothetical protein PVF80_14605, partial [Gammaproteobacteria bacterium]